MYMYVNGITKRRISNCCYHVIKLKISFWYIFCYFQLDIGYLVCCCHSKCMNNKNTYSFSLAFYLLLTMMGGKCHNNIFIH